MNKCLEMARFQVQFTLGGFSAGLLLPPVTKCEFESSIHRPLISVVRISEVKDFLTVHLLVHICSLKEVLRTYLPPLPLKK